MKKTSMIILIVILSMVFLSINVNAAYEIQNVVFNPENPIEKSSITVTATVIDLTDTDEVYIFIKECNGNTGVCDEPKNISMTKLEDTNDYQSEISLTFTGATYLDYWFNLFYNNEWIRVPEGVTEIYGNVEYGEETDNGDINGGTTNGEGSDNNGTPGFEIILILIAVIIGIYWFKRKR
jgi:hypothetical protein